MGLSVWSVLVSAAVEDKTSSLHSSDSIIRNRFRIAESDSGIAMDSNRNITGTLNFFSDARKPDSSKRLVLRLRGTQVHGGGVEKNEGSTFQGSGGDKAHAVSRPFSRNLIPREQFIRKRTCFRNWVDKDKPRPDFGSNLKNDGFF